MKRAARIAKWTCAAALSLIALLGVLFGALQTPPGKALLASTASSLASSADMKIEIAGVEGGVPWDMRIASVNLSDSKGAFARIEDISLKWRPFALAGGVIDVEAVDVAKLSLLRKPETPKAQATSQPSEGSLSLPSLRIGRLAIARITLSEPVIGSEAELSVHATLDMLAPTERLGGKLTVDRIDAPGKIAAVFDYTRTSGNLVLDLTASEPAGGMISHALSIEGLPPVTAAIKGDGLLSDFKARLNVEAGPAIGAVGSAEVRSVDGGHRLALDIEAKVANLLPEKLRPLLSGVSQLSAVTKINDAMVVSIESMNLTTSALKTSTAGSFDAARMRADLAFEAVLGSPEVFSSLASGATWRSVGIKGRATGGLAAPALTAELSAEQVRGAGYSAGAIRMTARTTPDVRQNLAIDLQGSAENLSAQDPAVASALGKQAQLSLRAARDASGLVTLNGFEIRTNTLGARFEGRASAQEVSGAINVDSFDLAVLSPIAKRPLAGETSLRIGVEAKGDLTRARLEVMGEGKEIATGIEAIDNLLGEKVTLAARVMSDDREALRIDGLQVSGAGFRLGANGAISREKADMKADLSIADLGLVHENLSGGLNGTAAFSGRLQDLGVELRLQVPKGAAMRQPIENLSVQVSARNVTGAPDAALQISGRIAGRPVTGAGRYGAQAKGHRIEGLSFSLGSVNAKADVVIDANGSAIGRINIAAANLADISALALTELRGRLNVDLALDAPNNRQRVSLRADADDVRAAGNALDRARINLTVDDARGAPMLNGNLDISGAKAAGVVISKAALNAEPAKDGALIRLNAVSNGATVTGAAQLAKTKSGAAIRLDRLSVARGAAQVSTSAPANIGIADGTVTIDRLSLATRGGSAVISGSAGESLALNVDLRSLPLALIDLVSPGAGIAGSVTGAAKINGSAKSPEGTYKFSIARVSTPDTLKAGLGAIDIAAEGQLSGGRAQTRTRISAPFLSDFVISGSAPITAGELDLAIKGGVDLAAANAMLASTGARLTGRANVDATVKGPPNAPRAGGAIRISGGRFEDSVNGLNLSRIEGLVTGTDKSVTLSSLTAATPNGGQISARGAVSLDAAAGMPGKIDIELSNAGLINSELMRFVGEGRLSIEGALASAPRLTGRLTVKNLDVNIPDRLPGGAASLDVSHVNTGEKPKPAARAARRPAPAARPGAGMPLDIVVSAPNNVFVRGMGLEAELGGDLKLTGSSAKPFAQGAFEMRRGAFDIIGKRLNFTRGKVSFSGSLDPDLDFIAETRANDITAQIVVAGAASKPAISFTSSPALPQDEVLSRLLFGRGSGSLTPGQALQVAQTIAQFTGGGPGVLERMRRSLGVDSLNVGTNAAGTGGQVGVGKRLNDRIYLGMKQGTTPNSSQVTIDVDITRNIRVQGATGADGSAEVGIGAQWDY
jgi:translocation and assembly module TamB